MIHYHGGNWTDHQFWGMAGKHLCVSFMYPKLARQAKHISQSVMFDNGAFSMFTQNIEVDWNKYYRWVEGYIGHPHWAVVPDVIDGEEEDNLALIKEWPHREDCAAVVWHLSESIDHLLKLSDLGFGKLAFGSSGDYWQIGSDRWERRIDMAFNALAKNGPLPWCHMMRGLSVGGKRWPFASADSTSICQQQNMDVTKSTPESLPVAEYLARQIDSSQCPVGWNVRPVQQDLVA
jgi:hypothetical protein